MKPITTGASAGITTSLIRGIVLLTTLIFALVRTAPKSLARDVVFVSFVAVIVYTVRAIRDSQKIAALAAEAKKVAEATAYRAPVDDIEVEVPSFWPLYESDTNVPKLTVRLHAKDEDAFRKSVRAQLNPAANVWLVGKLRIIEGSGS